MSEENRQETPSPEIILNKGAKPFPSQIAAEAMLKLRRLENSHEVFVYEDGWGCRPKGGVAAVVEKQSKNLSPKSPPGERVFIVRFHAKGHPNDPDDVVLAVNGETLQIQREREVPLLERYMMCAKHATYQQFSQLPGQQRKKTSTVEKYPFDVIREGTYAEFIGARAAGNKITAPHIAELSII